jgi:two-component system sensor histidine kinase UhpB
MFIMSLRLQVNLIISTLLFLVAATLVSLKISNTRHSVHEEITASTVVATQLLSHMRWAPGTSELQAMTRFLQGVGRVRANHLELRDDEGTLVYQSPPPLYKAGRTAPAWFSDIVSPPLKPQVIALPVGHIVLQADASRAVLDGWDELKPMLWTVLAGFLTSNALIYALMGRVLRPLQRLVIGLRKMADGHYETRLQDLTGHEGREIGLAFNYMAQSVQDSIEARRQAKEAGQALAQNRKLTQVMQQRIERERAAISRELHDELGQQVTAIKSMGLAIARRAADTDPSIAQSARLVMQCADHIYDGMHRMIATLRPLALDQFGLYDALRDLAAECQLQHPELLVHFKLPETPEWPDDILATAVYRIVQEAVNNALKHAQASRLDVSVVELEDSLQLIICDNGYGRIDSFQKQGHFGLSGMRERVASLNGSFHLSQCEPHGIKIQVYLPFLAHPQNA